MKYFNRIIAIIGASCILILSGYTLGIYQATKHVKKIKGRTEIGPKCVHLNPNEKATITKN